LLELEKIYKALNERQIKKIISEWTSRSSTIGKNVELNMVDSKIKGKAIKIDDDGALIVSDKNKNHRAIAGDIIHLSK
jgi:BirA family biotin operon repressor/biotin-[acetyl-CoA-carboxylase] ligase